MKITILLFITLLSLANYGLTQTVTIGTQTWTTLNLDVASFRNGDVIPESKTNEEWEAAGINEQAAWCYYENDTSNGNKYGKLYNWYAVNDARGLAPIGWHIPADEAWNILTTFLGGEDVAGGNMKTSSGWYDNGNGNNSNGFLALPGASRKIDGYFVNIGYEGYWWSTSRSKVVRIFGMGAQDMGSSVIDRNDKSMLNGFSVRCVKD